MLSFSEKEHFRWFAPLGARLSIIGLGTVKFGRNLQVKNKTADGFALPDAAEVDRLLSLARELGINNLDTAPAYGNSEEKVGAWLAQNDKTRHFFVSTKVGEDFIDGKSHYDFTRPGIEASVSRSLRLLGRDVLDCVFVHCSRNDHELLVQNEVFQTLERLKERGWIRSYGASIYTLEAAEYTLEHADCLMVTLNPKEKNLLPLIGKAHSRDKGIWVKKGLCSGFVGADASAVEEPSISECMRLIKDTSGVTTMVLGTLNPMHLQDNVATMLGTFTQPWREAVNLPLDRIYRQDYMA